MNGQPSKHPVDRNALARDVELAILSDNVAAGSVYVDLDGFSPRILADIHNSEAFGAFARRFFEIIETLHTTFRAGGDGEPRPRGLTFTVESTEASNHQRLEARKALAARLAEIGCASEEIERLMTPSG